MLLPLKLCCPLAAPLCPTVAIVSGSIIDNLGNLRDMRSRIADDLEQSCFICNM
jgi:hypothetical protein